MKITDSNVWQRLVLKYYIPTKKYRQNTIELHFVKFKREKNDAIFIDLAVFLRVQFFPAQIKTFYHHRVLFYSIHF